MAKNAMHKLQHVACVHSRSSISPLPLCSTIGLRPGQGTNRNESLHRLLNSMNMNARYGPELAFSRLAQAFFQRNETIKARLDKRPPQSIEEYAATTAANSTREVFGYLPETTALATNSKVRRSIQPGDLLSVMDNILTDSDSLALMPPSQQHRLLCATLSLERRLGTMLCKP